MPLLRLDRGPYINVIALRNMSVAFVGKYVCFNACFHPPFKYKKKGEFMTSIIGVRKSKIKAKTFT